MNEYLTLFEEIDRAMGKRFGKLSLPFKIIGRAALEMAGLPERGTKDVDALEEFLRVATLSEEQLSNVEAFLKSEFGKGSPGALRHGLYLDLVGKSVAWLPPRPRFIDEAKYSSLVLSRLHPVDVCVSKTFSNFMRSSERSRDRTDIIEAIDAGLCEVPEYIDRLDKALVLHETQAGADEAFPRIITFIEEELLPSYSDSTTRLKYTLPSWMENI